MRITRQNENTSNGLHPLSNQLSIFCLLAYNAIKDEEKQLFAIQHYDIDDYYNDVSFKDKDFLLECVLKQGNLLFQYYSNFFFLITTKLSYKPSFSSHLYYI